MFYKPNYCCHCGDAIERVRTSLADSSRFCDVCKHDFVPQRLLPLAFGAAMAIVGLFGAGALLRRSHPPVVVTSAVRPSVSAERKMMPADASDGRAATVPSPRQSLRSETAPVTAPDESLAICGAPTKKGTPCSRRVRGGGRCWQHRGEAAANNVQK